MNLPFASFILKIFLLTLLSITINTKYSSTAKPSNKLFDDICPKTKNPESCLRILRFYSKTRLAFTLPSLGLGSLDIAISQAQSSVDLFHKSLMRQTPPLKKKYENCLDNYKLAMKQLKEAKLMFTKNNFASARKSLENASKVPTYCQKELGATTGAIKRANMMSNITFDIPFVIVKELESNKNSTKTAS